MRSIVALVGFTGAQGLYQTFSAEEALKITPPSSFDSGEWPVGPNTESMQCAVSVGKYPGMGWFKEGQTDGRRCLYQSEQERVEFHSRHSNARFGGKTPGNALWINQPDRVHVVAHIRSLDKFVVWKRSNYALEGTSYEVATGHLGEHETAVIAAKKVAKEVLQLPQLACHEPQQLGRHRADSEHGMGWIYSFVADCQEPVDGVRRVGGVADGEEPPQLVQLSRAQLRNAVAEGRFGEAKWSNSAALALLHAQARASASKAKTVQEQKDTIEGEREQRANGGDAHLTPEHQHHKIGDSHLEVKHLHRTNKTALDKTEHGSYAGKQKSPKADVRQYLSEQGNKSKAHSTHLHEVEGVRSGVDYETVEEKSVASRSAALLAVVAASVAAGSAM